MITSPADMAPLLASKNIENIFFKKHLRNFSGQQIDQHIHELYELVAKQIDCTKCANCCKKLEPGLDDKEISILAQKRNMSPESFRSSFVGYDGDACFLKTKPCMFLNGEVCSIYHQRPAACAGYPHLDGKDMKFKRSLWSNYLVCPIVFNVIEQLKATLHFSYGS